MTTPTAARPVLREWAEQTTDHDFLKLALPATAYFTAIDHARKMSLIQGGARKRRGVKAGIPDWLIIYNGITLWIERKAGASLSDVQRDTRDALLANGHQWRLARSTYEVESACLSVGIPLRARYTAPAAKTVPTKAKRKSAPRKPGPRFQMGKRAVTRARRAGIML